MNPALRYLVHQYLMFFNLMRIELEFLSAEGEKVHEQLLSQGLNPNEAAEKERWTFIYNDCEIVLDKLPFIGPFY
jgi:adenylate cyclase class IV